MMKSRGNGFTLVEVLVSMILISFASIFLMKCMITSLNSVKNSNLRFRVSRALDIKKNHLLSKSFNSVGLSEGVREENSDQIEIEISIMDLTPGLKKLTLTGRSGKFSTVSVFHISESIRGGKNE